MSSVAVNSAPIQSDRCEPQADLLIALRSEDYAGFEYILKNCGKRIDINYLYDGPDYKTLLEIACSCKKKSKFVERLLESGAVVNSLNKTYGKAPIHMAGLYSDFETLKLLVENPGVDINIRDKEGNTVLHYAVQQYDRETIGWLLDSGAHIGVPNSNGDPAVKFMKASTLEYLLDRCVSTRGQPLENDYRLVFDYSMLACENPRAIEETDLLTAISRVRELRPLLEHPVLTSFLDLKWQNVTCGLYWRILIGYTLLTISVTAYIMLAYVPQTMLLKFKERTLNASYEEDRRLFKEDDWEVQMRCLHSRYVICWWSAMLLIGCILFRELLQLFYSKCRYFNEWENYLKAAWLSVAYVTLMWHPQGLGVNESCPSPFAPIDPMYRIETDKMDTRATPEPPLDIVWRGRLAALTIFLSYSQLMLSISQHPVVSVGVYQFRRIIVSYTKLMSWSSAFMLAFVLSFYIRCTEWKAESYSKYTFANVSVYLVTLAFKTPDIWTGEFGFAYFWSGIYFVFVTVSLFSLVNSVATTNAVTINEQRVRFVSQAKFIVNMQKLAPDVIALVSLLAGCCYRSLMERRKGRQKQVKGSTYSAIFCASDRKVYVFVNRGNWIMAKNMRFKNEDVDDRSLCGCPKRWSFSKSCIERAKKIASQRSQVASSGVEVVETMANLQNRLMALEEGLKRIDGKQQSLMEAERRSLDGIDVESLKIEDRLQNAAKEVSQRAVAEIRNFFGEIVPQA